MPHGSESGAGGGGSEGWGCRVEGWKIGGLGWEEGEEVGAITKNAKR